MDIRRLSTIQCIEDGIGDLPKPKTSDPKISRWDLVRDNTCDREFLRAGLEKGGLKASMYCGIWKIWKTEKGFSGELLQYRVITESFYNQLQDEMEYWRM